MSAEQTAVTRYSGGIAIQLFGWEFGIRRIDYKGSYEEMQELIDDE